ncbi:MAG: hypothetical protein ACYSU0_23440, partial [Planctomycetota bacterium]
MVGDHAQAADSAPGDAPQARAGVDVLKIDDRVLPGQVHAVGGDGRPPPSQYRDRLEQGVTVGLVQQDQVVERIGQVDS